jgi:hypothetical protein
MHEIEYEMHLNHFINLIIHNEENTISRVKSEFIESFACTRNISNPIATIFKILKDTFERTSSGQYIIHKNENGIIMATNENNIQFIRSDNKVDYKAKYNTLLHQFVSEIILKKYQIGSSIVHKNELYLITARDNKYYYGTHKRRLIDNDTENVNGCVFIDDKIYIVDDDIPDSKLKNAYEELKKTLYENITVTEYCILKTVYRMVSNFIIYDDTPYPKDDVRKVVLFNTTKVHHNIMVNYLLNKLKGDKYIFGDIKYKIAKNRHSWTWYKNNDDTYIIDVVHMICSPHGDINNNVKWTAKLNRDYYTKF